MFVSDENVDTTATFSDSGSYVLQLLADDSELQAADTLGITVLSAGPTTMHVESILLTAPGAGRGQKKEKKRCERTNAPMITRLSSLAPRKYPRKM